MKCETRKVDGVTLFDITGDIVFNNLNELREVIKAEMNEPETDKVLISLSDVGMIDSAGVGFIVSVYKTVLSRKGSFALVQPNDAVKNVLQTVGLTRLFKVFDNEEEAVKSI
ncbi:MAG: STAS domain-containing protein [Nitrospinota bacterium]